MKGYTIQHSIDLLEDQVEDLEARPSGGDSAADVSYDNTGSGLTADDVQEAIDELNTAIGQIDTSVNYSTTEKVIGVWIDGTTPVYEKTIETGAMPNNTTKSVAHNISDLGHIISMIGCATSSVSGNHIQLGAINNVSPSDQIVMYCNATNLIFVTGADRTSYDSSYVIMRYTKTAPESNTRSKKSKKEE